MGDQHRQTQTLKEKRQLELELRNEKLRRTNEELLHLLKARTDELEDTMRALRTERSEHAETVTRLRIRENERERLLQELETADAGFTALLRRRDREKEVLREEVLNILQQLILPSLERLKRSGLTDRQLGYLQTVEANLGGILAPLGRRILALPALLTQTEMQVANLIKQGKKTSEIARLLNASPRTVETHRTNIRKKLRIDSRTTTLQKHLLSFQ
ncbi:MAG: LuxR C-terminal-related transcriptional regulator [Desulfobacteraceae bacterium]|nr:LuxR C-terminal-related transcriptional regulator [Desulfobacteraceae bacterium]